MAKENRSAARLAAVQAAYQMDITGKNLLDVCAEFETWWIGQEVEGNIYIPAEIAFFRDILTGLQQDQYALDRLVDDTLQAGWPLRRIEALLRAILRCGTYELKKRRDIPARVVIAEYVDVTGAFFNQDEAGMVNAVMDTLARTLRKTEFEHVPNAI